MFGGTVRGAGTMTARATRAFVLALMLTLAGAVTASSALAASIDIHGLEYRATGAQPALSSYTYIVNVDNAKDPQDPDPLNHPGFGGTLSNSEVVSVGDETSGSFNLPDGKYVISLRSPDHKLWGKHIQLPQDAGVVNIALRNTVTDPIPRGKIRVIVFDDNNWVNSALDAGETGIAGIHVVVFDQAHAQVTTDGRGDPICGGRCVTDSDGFVQIDNLNPGLYHVETIAPKGTGWHQDTTIDGGLFIPIGVQEGADGTGTSVLAGLAEVSFLPVAKRTVNQIGMVRNRTFTASGTGRIYGTAKGDVSWPPSEDVTLEETLDRPYVALSDMSTDAQVWTGRGNRDGTFNITGVPAGSYFVSIWDEQLNYVIRFMTIDVAAGEQVNLDSLDGNGDGQPDGGVGVPRWTGFLEGDVYYDANGNQLKDPGEKAVPNTDVDQRWRDGSIKEGNVTDKNGHYVYTQAEGGPLGKWFIGEVGFSRYATTGASWLRDPNYHTPFAADFPADVVTVDTTLGGGLLTNQQVAAGHHQVVNWGKKVYAEGETGQIVGVVYHGTTRNEVDARNQGHEDYEPGIPGVVVRLTNLQGDTLNEYTTDGWTQPKNCEMRDIFGGLVAPGFLNPAITTDCLEAPSLSGQTVDGKFDGGYAFADMCPVGTFPCADADLVPLAAGKYAVQVLMPNDGNGNDLYQITKEEDVNVDNGPNFTPALPQPECIGAPHEVPANDFTTGRGGTAGKIRRLCDVRLVTLKNKQNFNADFYVFTSNDVEVPGRVVGLVSNDVYVDTNSQNIWFQNKRGEPHVPLGIYDRDPDQGGRLIKTIESDESGEYEVLLPSTETINCPTPQGICPGEYWFVINDAGTKEHPNDNYRQDLLTDGIAGEVWPGQTTQLDTPVTPISGDGCAMPGTTPNFMQASKPFVLQTDTGVNRRITLEGLNLGAPGSITLAGNNFFQSRTLTLQNGGIVSWTADTIVINVPAASGTFFGPKQLLINADTGDTSQTGMTLHVFRTTGPGGSYNPPRVTVGSPTSNAHALQNAIDGAAPGSLVVLAKGTYNENIILNKPLLLQGSGPGGFAGGNGQTSLPGTQISGAYFAQNASAWRAKLGTAGNAANGWDGNTTIAEGAAITVVAKDTGARRFRNNALAGPARIDAIDIHNAQSGGAGGIQVNAYARDLQITNNLLEGNGGQYAGAIAIGVEHGNGANAAQSSNHNEGTVIRYDRVEGNGAKARSGGIAVFYGADNYQIRDSIICSNYSFEYGGGITQYGRSDGGSITDNTISYNAAFDSGGAITLSEQLRSPAALGTGTGAVDVDRNLIEGNFSGDDGGALYLRSAYGARVNIRGNMMVANASADAGGAVMLADSSNVTVVNNTVADNATTGTVETRVAGVTHAAGLTSEVSNPAWQAQQAGSAPHFSRPVQMFNNIFTTNTAYTYQASDNTLVDHGFLDFEVLGTAGTLNPSRSVLSVPYGPPANNIVGLDPLFLTAQAPTFLVQASAADPNFVSVSLTRGNLPQGLLGDYHLSINSGAIDRGVAFQGTGSTRVNAPTRDIDQDFRPQLRTPGRQATPFDLGADEVPN